MYPQNRNQIAYLFNKWVFGRICNPPELSISIFNALFRMYITSFIDSLNSYDEHIFPLLNS